MNDKEFAERCADRITTGYASSGQGLRLKIKDVIRNEMADHEIEARQLERELETARRGHRSTCSLLAIQIERLKLDMAKAQREAADNTVQYRTQRLSVRQWENRTGLNHDKLLEGTYHDPYGT